MATTVPALIGPTRIGLILALTVLQTVGSQARIVRLDRNDPVYLQFQRMIEINHRAQQPNVLFAVYTPSVGETLFSIAARLSLPYQSISTLNRLSSPEIESVDTILVPSAAGVFVYDEPYFQLEHVIAERLATARGTAVTVPLPDQPLGARFVPGADFTPEERGIFFRIVFSAPLDRARLSSSYGYRTHPTSGLPSFHAGIDLVADFGAPVVAAADGVVTAIDRDRIYGLSVRLSHGRGYRTLYAHLSEVLVQPGARVAAGSPIARLGSTGFSTGPHVHFELHRNGRPEDPLQYLTLD